MQSSEQVNARYKIDEIVNKFLLTGNKFKKPGFTYRACGKKQEIHDIFIRTN